MLVLRSRCVSIIFRILGKRRKERGGEECLIRWKWILCIGYEFKGCLAGGDVCAFPIDVFPRDSVIYCRLCLQEISIR